MLPDGSVPANGAETISIPEYINAQSGEDSNCNHDTSPNNIMLGSHVHLNTGGSRLQIANRINDKALLECNDERRSTLLGHEILQATLDIFGVQ